MAVRAKWWVPAVAAFMCLALAGAGIVVVQQVSASSTISGLKASSVVNASRMEVWFGQLTAPGVCRLIPSCVKGKKVPGGYRFRLAAQGPSGKITQVVRARTLDQRRPSYKRLELVAPTSSLGSFRGDLTIGLAKESAHRTRVSVTVVDATATGAIGKAIIPLIRTNLTPNLDWTTRQLNIQRKAAGVEPALRLSKPNKARARVTVSAAHPSLIVPKANGKVRILVAHKVVCSGSVRKSKGQCRFKPPGAKSRVTAVVTGKLTTGFQVWNGTTARWSR